MAWIRTSKTDGAELHEDEERVAYILDGHYRNLSEAIRQAKEEGVTLQSLFAFYKWRE